jgi:Asp/Glu/hydantoin racemase
MVEEKNATKVYYGQAIGLIIGPVKYFRLPGDICKATTFDFPVQYKIVDPMNVVKRQPSQEDAQKIVTATVELEKEGVRAVGTDCGFMVYFQEVMANNVDIPVASSSLLQVPLVSMIIGKEKRVGIITYNSRALSEEHLRRAGIDPSIPIAIFGLETLPHSTPFDDLPVDPKQRLHEFEMRLVSAAQQLHAQHQDLGAFVLECTQLPVAAAAIQEATGLPVFDVTTLLKWVHLGICRKRFEGFM